MKAIAIILLLPSIAWSGTISVPKDHYLGISSPCASVADARREAFQDVSSQILRTIGATYSVEFSSRMAGNTKDVVQSIDERFHYSASGFLAGIESRIVSQEYGWEPGGVVYRMLVHYPASLIARMRRLSRGAKVLATRVRPGEYQLREVNGVACVLTEAAYAVSSRNRNAGFLNYYVMKVSSGESQKLTKPLPEPVVLQNGESKRIYFKVPNDHRVKDLLLGTQRYVQITLIGTDEVGRSVKVKMSD